MKAEGGEKLFTQQKVPERSRQHLKPLYQAAYLNSCAVTLGTAKLVEQYGRKTKNSLLENCFS